MSAPDHTADTLAVPLSPQDIARIFRRTHGGSLSPSDWEFADQLQRECMLRMGVATLRDYFAAKAMQGDWACGNAGINGCPLADDAERYYAMADAMLKERAK